MASGLMLFNILGFLPVCVSLRDSFLNSVGAGVSMDLKVSREEILEYQRLKIISQLAPIRERILFFERKYGCSFEDFEKRIKEGSEDFDMWDDYIEWKSYGESFRDLKAKLEKIKDAKKIIVT